MLLKCCNISCGTTVSNLLKNYGTSLPELVMLVFMTL